MTKYPATHVFAAPLLLLLANCSQPAGELIVTDLRLSPDRLDTIESVQDKSVTIDQQIDEAAVPIEIRVLRRAGISSSAYFRFFLSEPERDPVMVKVKINVFTGPDVATAHWNGSYGEDVKIAATNMEYGDASFRIQQRFHAIRAGRCIAEFISPEPSSALSEFVSTYMGFLGDSRCIARPG